MHANVEFISYLTSPLPHEYDSPADTDQEQSIRT